MNRKPPRPVGLSLALLASVFLFSLLPLAQFARLVMLQARLRSLSVVDGDQSLVMGGYYTTAPNEEVYLRAGLGALFLVVAIGAWQGRPRGIRMVMVAAILLLTVVTTALTLASLSTPQSIATGLDSGYAMWRSLVATQLCMSLSIPLYALWYMNRGPARAFYRGAYLPAPETDKKTGSSA